MGKVLESPKKGTIVVDAHRGRQPSLLVLGGARSGKSRFAQEQAEARGLEPVFVATAQAHDAEMAERIARHARERDARWSLVEEPFSLAETVMARAGMERILLVDCLTLWLGNIMLRGDDVDLACADLVAVVPALAGPSIFVSNEVGQGIVPDNALARRFRDAQGRLNQALAAACDHVVLVSAGLPLRLKPAPPLGAIF